MNPYNAFKEIKKKWKNEKKLENDFKKIDKVNELHIKMN